MAICELTALSLRDIIMQLTATRARRMGQIRVRNLTGAGWHMAAPQRAYSKVFVRLYLYLCLCMWVWVGVYACGVAYTFAIKCMRHAKHADSQPDGLKGKQTGKQTVCWANEHASTTAGRGAARGTGQAHSKCYICISMCFMYYPHTHTHTHTQAAVCKRKTLNEHTQQKRNKSMRLPHVNDCHLAGPTCVLEWVIKRFLLRWS